MRITVTVDGTTYTDDVEPRLLLVHYLRDRLGKVGTVVGCDTSNCGACTVHLNGHSVKSCSVLAVQADGGDVLTVEGLSRDGTLHPIQEAFRDNHALQCGFCTPGMIMQTLDLLAEEPDPDDETVRHGLEGNLCRCTGYQNIVRAVQDAAQRLRGGATTETVTECPDGRNGRGCAMTATAEPEIGKARLRKEDEHLITGRTRWTDNLVLPGMQHLAILRSPLAHARITGIDTSAARAMPGVVAVFTGADLAAEQGSLPCAWQITEDMKAPPAPSLAVDTVNFAGEAVAVVVARSAYEAHDALEAIDVDYEELPVVLDLAAAAADGADLVHPDLGTNISAIWTFDSAEAGTGSDVEQAIRDAEVVVQRTFRQQRLIPAFMEPRSVVVDPTGAADHRVVRHPDPAHPAAHAGDDAGDPGAQGAGHRPGRRRRFRRQAAGDAGGGDRTARRAAARQAGEVHRVP